MVNVMQLYHCEHTLPLTEGLDYNYEERTAGRITG